MNETILSGKNCAIAKEKEICLLVLCKKYLSHTTHIFSSKKWCIFVDSEALIDHFWEISGFWVVCEQLIELFDFLSDFWWKILIN